MGATVNEKAVAMFREHLPPHLAEICIEAHIKAVVRNPLEFMREPIHLEDALYKNTQWIGEFSFQTLFECCTGNIFAEKLFYERCPEYRPTELPAQGNEDKGVSGDEPFELTVDEMIETHLPIREASEAELSASSNALDTRDTMHSNEPPPVEIDVVIRQLAHDVPVHKSDIIKAIDIIEYKLHKLLEAQNEDIINPQGFRRLYTNYVRLASSNDPIFNQVMHTNDDGSLRMFHYEEFVKSYYWIYPLLNSTVVSSLSEKQEYLNTKFNTNYEIAERERITTALYRSDSTRMLNQILGLSAETERKVNSTKILVIVAVILTLINTAIALVHLFIK